MKKAFIKKFHRTTDMGVKAMTRSFGQTLEDTKDSEGHSDEKRIFIMYGRGLKIKVVFTASRYTEDE